jgi:hypothetical protein
MPGLHKKTGTTGIVGTYTVVPESTCSGKKLVKLQKISLLADDEQLTVIPSVRSVCFLRVVPTRSSYS